ncbi:hypothetical protein A4H97_20940 [Niastella yeongjuensis]|uniref:Uncharacterized protein n=1 Tax=Niastella yeongjuensis TaxID=354355 RepID=A0A1V9FCE1_9BACT|nr:hypothetical protein A4H97_20940 [Niastella yeongjuensis]
MSGMAARLLRDEAGLAVEVVRDLFGFLPGTPQHSRGRSEQIPNKINSNPGTIPASSTWQN